VQRPPKLKAALSALDLSVDDDGYIDGPQEEAVRLIIDHAKCWTVEVVSDAERGVLHVADGAAG
jgi:hypothetical protein